MSARGFTGSINMLGSQLLRGITFFCGPVHLSLSVSACNSTVCFHFEYRSKLSTWFPSYTMLTTLTTSITLHPTVTVCIMDYGKFVFH